MVGEFGYQSWLDAVRAGRTFVSNAPLLLFEVDGQGPGAELRKPSGVAAEVAIRARALSRWPLDRLEILYNGEVVRTVGPAGDAAGELVFEGRIATPESGWLAARSVGPRHRLVMGGPLFPAPLQLTHTAAVWLEVEGRPAPVTPHAARFVEWIDSFSAMMEREGRFENPSQRQHAMDTFARARAVFERLAARSDR